MAHRIGLFLAIAWLCFAGLVLWFMSLGQHPDPSATQFLATVVFAIAGAIYVIFRGLGWVLGARRV